MSYDAALLTSHSLLSLFVHANHLFAIPPTTNVLSHCFLFFFFNDTATTEIYTLSLHDALPIYQRDAVRGEPSDAFVAPIVRRAVRERREPAAPQVYVCVAGQPDICAPVLRASGADDQPEQRLASARNAQPAARRAVHVQSGERPRVLRHQLRRDTVVQCSQQVVHRVGRSPMTVYGPRGGRLLLDHERVP